MSFYKIQHNDVFKILPIIDANGKICRYIESRCLFLPKSQIMIYDIDRRILPKLWKFKPKLMSTKYFLSILINDEIKNISVGRQIFDKINDTPNATNLKDDTQLLVKVDMKNSPIGQLPSYDESEFIQKNWKRPFQYEDKDKWVEWLKAGQKDLWSLLAKNDVKNHIHKIEAEVGESDTIAGIISELRDEKLDIILE